MNRIAQRNCGAVSFTKVILPTPYADTTVFSKQSSELKDQAWEKVTEKLKSFTNLEMDWDGNQSVPPESLLIVMAVQLANQLRDIAYPAPDRVVAGVNGTISFEYNGDPFEEIEVVTPFQAEVFENGMLVRTLNAGS